MIPQIQICQFEYSQPQFWHVLRIPGDFDSPQALGCQALQLCRRALELCCERTSSNTKLQATWQRSKNGGSFPDPLYM